MAGILFRPLMIPLIYGWRSMGVDTKTQNNWNQFRVSLETPWATLKESKSLLMFIHHWEEGKLIVWYLFISRPRYNRVSRSRISRLYGLFETSIYLFQNRFASYVACPSFSLDSWLFLNLFSVHVYYDLFWLSPPQRGINDCQPTQVQGKQVMVLLRGASCKVQHLEIIRNQPRCPETPRRDSRNPNVSKVPLPFGKQIRNTPSSLLGSTWQPMKPRRVKQICSRDHICTSWPMSPSNWLAVVGNHLMGIPSTNPLSCNFGGSERGEWVIPGRSTEARSHSKTHNKNTLLSYWIMSNT